jgi:maltose O-acetyltransferase
MVELKKLLRVAKEEIGFDPRRVAAHAVSRLFPQHNFSRIRTASLRALGLPIGRRSLFAGAVRITGSGSVADLLSIGPGCHITGPLHIDLAAPVRIGARVYMGYDVMLVTVDHDLDDAAQRCGERVYRPVDIEDGVWLGSRVSVLPGVRIGRGAVVATGAVVTRDVPPNTLVGGVPARFIRNLDDAAAGSARHARVTAATFASAAE